MYPLPKSVFVRLGLIYSHNLNIVMSAKDNSGGGGIGGSGGSSELQGGPSKKKEELVKRREYRIGQTMKKYTTEDVSGEGAASRPQ